MADKLVVVEEVEPILETEIKAAGIACHGKDFLPRMGELSPEVLTPAVERLLRKEAAPAPEPAQPRRRCSRGRRRCAPPVRTWASTTRCRS
jgi:TPP-dependent indolepyruvate ferredoxin oxidoreductase alpha subunit